jgi:hypothetical protein
VRRLLLVAALLTGCAGDPVTEGVSTAASSEPCRPAPAVTGTPPAVAPDLPSGAVLTELGPDVVGGRVEAPLDEVVAGFRAALERDGNVLTGVEDEGRAVRLRWFGVRGAGTVSVAGLPCPRGSTGFSVRVTQGAG